MHYIQDFHYISRRLAGVQCYATPFSLLQLQTKGRGALSDFVVFILRSPTPACGVLALARQNEREREGGGFGCKQGHRKISCLLGVNYEVSGPH